MLHIIFPVALLAVSTLSSTVAFLHPRTSRQFQHTSALPHRLQTRLFRVKHSIELPPNEFSRKLQPSRILKIKRDYDIDIEASQEECQALADRFDLSDIAKLSASLKLRQERIGGSRAGTNGVEVEGSVTATVTQRCVRTNEEFQVNLEFPLYCIVRPVVPLATLMQENVKAVRRDEPADSKPRKNSYRGQDRNVGEMDMMELQRMLQQDISSEDDALMEDEAIYPLDGLFDVGELVSQLFWLKLDPYPKKPGTDFFSASISG
ncbi:predicted protein [Phaeodactylum tricornutum CCAP 1055/1]|jgi:hypothetical protein|uniref:Uncharacterized protein n=1 Tax=Phaeodactylum tricornutum (strain CCAP 1055/1) TaxID=556484 RepID=B7G2W8_PHATC|nr:predicted protein [Phaeodactylum tricornutum CCAP 1055/1]EEC47379.1 predicted protein [Phaeodactylum tricornutum CCAP 1055/1]|eukprot:XP_002181456.1 predicted protein [Phaeodactylum tricornutum CCAP 1055/1]